MAPRLRPNGAVLTGASRAAVQRNLAWMEERGLVREVTGQGGIGCGALRTDTSSKAWGVGHPEKVLLDIHWTVQDVKGDDRVTAKTDRVSCSDCSVKGL